MSDSHETGQSIRIREYRASDRATLLTLAERLTVGIAPWRSVEGMAAAARGWVETSISAVGDDHALFVAEHIDGAIVGFASAARQAEFTGEAQAYIGELAVAEVAEGQGIGRFLVAAIEAWADTQGLALIVLDTGAANTRARAFYERQGFVDESVRLTKVVKPSD